MAKLPSKVKAAIALGAVAIVAVIGLAIWLIIPGGLLAEPTPTEEPATPSQSSQPTDDTSTYDYNDLSSAIADIPAKAALDEIYIVLGGYWITDGNPFIGFITNGSGGHEIAQGLFQSSYLDQGLIVGGYATGQYEADLIVKMPAYPGNEMEDPRPEYIETLSIDLNGLYQGGDVTIKVRTEFFEDGAWVTYRPGGATIEEAELNR